MRSRPEEFVLDGIPALRWGKPGGQAVVGVHGRFSNKLDPVMSQCGDVIASRGDQLITFDLPTHGDCQDGKAFAAMAAIPEVRAFAQLARSQSTEVGLLASSIGAYFSPVRHARRDIRARLAGVAAHRPRVLHPGRDGRVLGDG